jgi:uncharacterized protein YbjT (DUF2867 family)
VLDVGDGPMMGQVSKYISSLGVEWAVLRPTWFMGELPPSPLSNNFIACCKHLC